MNETYLYPYSAKEARERNELSLWRESHRANIACRDAIEDAIRRSFDGMHLDKDCTSLVLEKYGYKRTAWVLANTLHELKWDGRFSHANKQWAEQDFTGKVLVLSPDTLKESCWSQENQLWYAHDGFGCRPHAIGRSVRCTCLGDGEMTRWNRHEFIGVLDEKHLPDWAQEKLMELTVPQQEAPTTGEMKLE